MHVVWQSDIHRVDVPTRQAVGILFVRIGVCDPVSPGQTLELYGIARDQSGNLGILPAVGKGRPHGNLRYVAETNDRVPHLLGFSLSGFSFAHEPAFLSCTLAHHCDAESPPGAAWHGDK
jgi:hypothetical protein